MAFTTNFDPVVEKAVAEMSGKPLSAYHLEGAHNVVSALNNEQFPIYCKLHGIFSTTASRICRQIWQRRTLNFLNA